jgi:hypothetical protein
MVSNLASLTDSVQPHNPLRIQQRHSYRTEQAYVHWIKRFIHFHGLRHSRELGQAEVTAFLNYLAGRGVNSPLDAGG